MLEIIYLKNKYVASNDSLKMALDLFDCMKRSNFSSKTRKDGENYQGRKKYHRLCSSSVTSKRANSRGSAAISFSPLYAFVEIQKCFMRQDWISLKRLFPIVLNISTTYDALMWRYAFAIFLHSATVITVYKSFSNPALAYRTRM